jgi:hypothetical protein
MCVCWFDGESRVACDGSPWTKDREARERFCRSRWVVENGRKIRNPNRQRAIAEAQMTMLGEGYGQ